MLKCLLRAFYYTISLNNLGDYQRANRRALQEMRLTIMSRNTLHSPDICICTILKHVLDKKNSIAMPKYRSRNYSNFWLESEWNTEWNWDRRYFKFYPIPSYHV